MNDPMLPLPGLSPVSGKAVVARFDGGQLSSDGGAVVLREIAQRLGLAERLAACIDDPRDQNQIVHPLAALIDFRMLMIACGYEDGNDATALRSDPAFKLAQGVLLSGPDLACAFHHLAPGKSAYDPYAVAHGASVYRFLLRLLQARTEAESSFMPIPRAHA